jgi:hypothetical protein
VTFFLNKNVFIALVTYKISIKNHYITLKDSKGSIEEFNYVAWVVATTSNNIASISKIVFANLRAKGLRLHKALRTRGR